MLWDEVNYFSPEQGSPQLKAWLGMQLNSSTQQLIQAQKWPGRDQLGTPGPPAGPSMPVPLCPCSNRPSSKAEEEILKKEGGDASSLLVADLSPWSRSPDAEKQ